MAKALQRLIAASNDKKQYFALDWLKTKFEYGGRIRDFKQSLDSACNELKRLEIISNWQIKDSTRGEPQLSIYLPNEIENT